MSPDPSRPDAAARPSPPRSPRKLSHRLLERTVEGWERLLERPLLWGTLFAGIGVWVLAPELALFTSRVPAGSIAHRDYTAPRDLWLLDEGSTREKERRAREEVLPVYDFDSEVIREKQREIGRLFAEGRRFLEQERSDGRREPSSRRDPSSEGATGSAGTAPPATTRVERFAQRLQAEPPLTPFKLTPEQIALLLEEGFSPELEDRLKSLVRQVLTRGVVSNKTVLLENRMHGITRRDLATGDETTVFDLFNYLGHPAELRELVESEVRPWAEISREERPALVELLLANLHPNLNFNQSETLSRRDAAAAAVDKVFTQIRKGQVVVRKGDEVGAFEARVIAELAGRRRWDRILLPSLGNLFLLALAAATLWLGLRGERVGHHSRRRLVSETLILLPIGLVGVKINFVMAKALAGAFENPPFNQMTSWIWTVPFAVVALLATLLCGRNVALVVGLLFSVLASRLGGGEAFEVLIYSLAGTLAAVFAVDRFELKQRLGLARIGFVVGLVNVLTILILLVVRGPIEQSAARIGFELLCGFTGGLLAAAVASFALPILESLFGITTDIKLLELANTNLPLLRRLAFEAPGTFQHSLMVSNLAKAGCEAIGADAALAYTGGLYHDVGKILRPEYFIENQRSGVNPHDKLQPSMSALILISHIKDGMDLARQHHLPRPILDAIEQHHGTRKMTFFYSRALERCDPETGEVSEEKYRYPGPRPRDKVLGVLMLADGVEAASRTLVEPNPAKLRSLVRTLVEDCLKDGQLDRTDLTLSDLQKVSEAFLRILANLHHQRVDYPGFDFNRLSRPRRLPAAKAS